MKNRRLFHTTVTLITDEADVVQEHETVAYVFDLADVSALRGDEDDDGRCYVYTLSSGSITLVNAPYAEVLAAWAAYHEDLASIWRLRN
jgi:hypothetical protein